MDETHVAEPRSAKDRSKYLSAKDAADLLGVNRATVINWARQGKFGGFQYGHRGIYRFDRQEITQFIEQSRLPVPARTDSDEASIAASG